MWFGLAAPLLMMWFIFLLGFEVQGSLQAEEALLKHPLIIQELWPRGSKESREIRGLTHSDEAKNKGSGFLLPDSSFFVKVKELVLLGSFIFITVALLW